MCRIARSRAGDLIDAIIEIAGQVVTQQLVLALGQRLGMVGDAGHGGVDPHAAHQSELLEPVHQPGHPRSGEQHDIGEFGHPESLLRRFGQRFQHVVSGQRQPLLGDQIAFQAARDPGVCAQKTAVRQQFVSSR